MDGRQRISRAVWPDDRSVPSIRPAACLRGSTRRFAEDDLRDLQVWHKLAWMDPDLLSQTRGLSPSSRRIADSARTTRQLLRSVELDLLCARGPAYREAALADRSSSPRRRSITRSCRCCATRTRIKCAARLARPRTRFTRPAMRGCRSSARWRFTKRLSDAGRRDVALRGIGVRRSGLR
jgi:hypothetical protein